MSGKSQGILRWMINGIHVLDFSLGGSFHLNFCSFDSCLLWVPQMTLAQGQVLVPVHVKP